MSTELRYATRATDEHMIQVTNNVVTVYNIGTPSKPIMQLNVEQARRVSFELRCALAIMEEVKP